MNNHHLFLSSLANQQAINAQYGLNDDVSMNKKQFGVSDKIQEALKLVVRKGNKVVESMNIKKSEMEDAIAFAKAQHKGAKVTVEQNGKVVREEWEEYIGENTEVVPTSKSHLKSLVRQGRKKAMSGEPKPTDKAPEPKPKKLPKEMENEAIKYDSAGDSTGTVTGKGKRDRGPGGQVMVKYKGSETYPKGAKLPIGARDMGRLIKQARKSGTTPYDSRNLRNPQLTKDHVELEGLDLSEMNFLGKDKKFGREFYEKDGQLHVKKPGGTYVQNLGSVNVSSNKRMMKGLVKDHVEHEVNEAVKVGDTVHIGHGTKGGTGVTGKVTKVSGGMVHIQNDKGDTFKGPVDRVTAKESADYYKPATKSDRAKNITKRNNAPSRTPHPSQAGLRMKQQNQESVEVKKTSAGDRTTPGTAGQNPLITAFGGDKEMRNAPSYLRYQARLKAEREARAKKFAAQQKKESVELDELKMPKKDKFGRIKSGKIRAAYRKGAQRASDISHRATKDMTGSPDPKKRYKGLNRGMNAVGRMMDRDDKGRSGGLVSSYEPQGNQLDEVSPPGFEGTVKAMKKRHKDEIDNPWALAWYMKNKGYKSHKNKDGSDKKEN